MVIKQLSLFLLLFTALFQADAANWYVATNGNDNNPGTLAAPFKTLPAAIAAAEPGDVIELRGGTYLSNEIRINKSNLTIRAYGGEQVKIQAVTNVEDISACLWYNEPETVGGLLENLEIVGGYYYAIKFETNWDWDNSVPFAQRRGVSNVTVRHCNIHHSGRDGIKLTPACANISILNCEIHHTGVGPGALIDLNAEGIDNVNAPNLTVRGCYIHDIATTGLYVKGGGRNCVIEGNRVENCGEGGIYLGFYTDAEWFDTDFNPQYFENINGWIANNIILNTQHAGIGLWGAKDAQVYHNTVINGAQAEHANLFFNTADVWLDDNHSARPANQNVRVRNNVFVQAASQNLAMVRIRDGALTGNNLIDNNVYHDPNGALFLDDALTWEDLSFAQWKSQAGRDGHSLDSNPKLDGTGHLLAGSPCIGQAAVVPGLTKDIDGALRDLAPDIGADEYGAVSGLETLTESPALQVLLLGNPTLDGQLKCRVRAEKSSRVLLQIQGMDGRLRREQFVLLNLGDTFLELPLQDLPSGSYVLRVGRLATVFVL